MLQDKVKPCWLLAAFSASGSSWQQWLGGEGKERCPAALPEEQLYLQTGQKDRTCSHHVRQDWGFSQRTLLCPEARPCSSALSPCCVPMRPVVVALSPRSTTQEGSSVGPRGARTMESWPQNRQGCPSTTLTFPSLSFLALTSTHKCK